LCSLPYAMGHKITHYFSVLQNHIICNILIPFNGIKLKIISLSHFLPSCAFNTHTTARALVLLDDVCHLQLVMCGGIQNIPGWCCTNHETHHKAYQLPSLSK
jgi:hypothetical protein